MNTLANDLLKLADSLSAIIYYEQKNIIKNGALEIISLEDRLKKSFNEVQELISKINSLQKSVSEWESRCILQGLDISFLESQISELRKQTQ